MPSTSEEPRDNRDEERESAPAGRSEREPLPQFDWLTEVAIPICVFGLLGSLLYYLIEVRSILAPAFAAAPLRWVVFWFLLACIGIARIRTKYGGAAIAGYYSALLAGAIALFVWVYTDRAGAFHASAEHGRAVALIFNWALVAVVWWAASAVTREATLEENVETQLEGGLWTLIADEWQYPDAEDRAPDEEIDHAKVRPRHPGRLVLWVSLAALVLFAVGQRSIGDEGQHAEIAFACMAAYVLFALLLLALTNLSALRMQVRRRGISLAPAVTPAWIVASALVVLGIIFFSFSLAPRFGTEAHERIAAVPEWLADARERGLDEGPAQGLGPEGEAPGEEENGSIISEHADQALIGEEGEEAGGAEEGEPVAPDGDGPGPGEGEGDEVTTGHDGDEPIAAQTRPDSPEGTGLLLWLLLILAALAVLYFLWLYRRQLLEAARQIASALARLPGHVAQVLARAWERALAWLATLGLPSRAARTGNLPEDPFVDIFERGLADDLEPAEVVRYVYRAFQTYAARGGHERRDDQTALEFLQSLPARLSLPDRAAERLTRAYVLATYSPREVTEGQVEGARNTWMLMRERLER